MGSLFACNNEAKIIPPHLFYNPTVPASLNIYTEWENFVMSDMNKVFNYFSYPFLLPAEVKNDIIHRVFSQQKVLHVREPLCHAQS